MIDPISERIRMIGPDVRNVQPKQMQEAAQVQSTAAGQSLREMVKEADANLLVVIKGYTGRGRGRRRKQ